MPPSPFSPAEGYWSDADSKEKNKYMPIISKKPWPDKTKFLRAVGEIENSMPRLDFDIRRENQPFYVVNFRGLSYSRINGEGVGSSEFQDTTQNIKWPAGFVEHYIGKYNVMPTKRFFDYVVYRTQHKLPRPLPLPAKKPKKPKPAKADKATKSVKAVKPQSTKVVKPAAHQACPKGKIMNPATNRCVLLSGALGKKLAQKKK